MSEDFHFQFLPPGIEGLSGAVMRSHVISLSSMAFCMCTHPAVYNMMRTESVPEDMRHGLSTSPPPIRPRHKQRTTTVELRAILTTMTCTVPASLKISRLFFSNADPLPHLCSSSHLPSPHTP